MQRHLNEARAAQRVLNHTQVAARGNGVTRRKVIDVQRGVREERVERHIVVRRVEVRMIEQVQEICPVRKGESLGEFCILPDCEIKARLEGAAEQVSTAASVVGFESVAGTI